MPISAKIVLDSMQPDDVRLTTMEVVMPRFVLAEFNTHRAFSKNSASSRAIPTDKLIQSVLDDPVIPVEWGRNQPGMQAREALAGTEAALSLESWLMARDESVHRARQLAAHGVHKQIVNRLLEPWMYTTVLVSGTSRAYRHFFALRCHPDAQPEMRTVAEAMHAAYAASAPSLVKYDGWHLPYVTSEDWDAIDAMLTAECGDTSDHRGRLADVCAIALKVSVARCARVSYLRQGEKRDLPSEIAVHDRLRNSGHWSPFEHVAMAQRVSWSSVSGTHGNFEPGWVQLRKTFREEYT